MVLVEQLLADALLDLGILRRHGARVILRIEHRGLEQVFGRRGVATRQRRERRLRHLRHAGAGQLAIDRLLLPLIIRREHRRHRSVDPVGLRRLGIVEGVHRRLGQFLRQQLRIGDAEHFLRQRRARDRLRELHRVFRFLRFLPRIGDRRIGLHRVACGIFLALLEHRLRRRRESVERLLLNRRHVAGRRRHRALHHRRDILRAHGAHAVGFVRHVDRCIEGLVALYPLAGAVGCDVILGSGQRPIIGAGVGDRHRGVLCSDFEPRLHVEPLLRHRDLCLIIDLEALVET